MSSGAMIITARPGRWMSTFGDSNRRFRCSPTPSCLLKISDTGCATPTHLFKHFHSTESPAWHIDAFHSNPTFLSSAQASFYFYHSLTPVEQVSHSSVVRSAILVEWVEVMMDEGTRPCSWCRIRSMYVLCTLYVLMALTIVSEQDQSFG